MDDRLKDLLRAQIEGEVGSPPAGGLPQVVRSGRRKKAVARVLTAAGIVGAIAATAVVPRLPVFTSDGSPPAGAAAPTSGDGCPASQSAPGPTRWTSPVVHVASGSFDGKGWVLCVRTSENPGTEDEGLCNSWRLGDGLDSGMDCTFIAARNRPLRLDPGYFDVVMGPVEGYLYGAAPADAASVELRKAGGATVVGQVHPAPAELGVPFTFFTIFDEPYTEGMLVVRDGSGEVLVRREMDHGLAELSVDVSGDGRVRGYRTELLRVYEECRRGGGDDCRPANQFWIDCPDECSAGLAGAGITLVATPAEGGRFLGWSGACSGTGPCELVVDEPTDVGAAFAPSG